MPVTRLMVVKLDSIGYNSYKAEQNYYYIFLHGNTGYNPVFVDLNFYNADVYM